MNNRHNNYWSKTLDLLYSGIRLCIGRFVRCLLMMCCFEYCRTIRDRWEIFHYYCCRGLVPLCIKVRWLTICQHWSNLYSFIRLTRSITGYIALRLLVGLLLNCALCVLSKILLVIDNIQWTSELRETRLLQEQRIKNALCGSIQHTLIRAFCRVCIFIVSRLGTTPTKVRSALVRQQMKKQTQVFSWLFS